MDIYLWSFIYLMFSVIVITVFANIFYERFRRKMEILHFSKERLQQYEDNLKTYLQNNRIDVGTPISDICGRLGYRMESCNSVGKGKEAVIIEKEKVIRYNKNLSLRERNFDLAHEIAHVIFNPSENGDGAHAKWVLRSKRHAPIEQICDYYAAAILLPFEELKSKLDESEYWKCSRRERKNFIAEIADIKNVEIELVAKRIREVKIITGEPANI